MDQQQDLGLFEIRSKRFGADTDRAKAAALDLDDELRRAFRDELPKIPHPSGAKGDPITVGAIVIALISSGAITKALDCVKAWMERDPLDRQLRVKGNVGDRQVDLVVDATNIGDQNIHEIIRAVVGGAAAATA